MPTYNLYGESSSSPFDNEFGQTESPKPQFPNEKLGLKAKETDTFPSLDRADYVAKGGEAEVYKTVNFNYEKRDRYGHLGKREDLAIKIYHRDEVVGSFEDQIYALTAPVMSVATTARWADGIYNRVGIIQDLNANQYRLEQMGLGDPSAYTLDRLRETYIDFRQLDHRGIVIGLVRMFEEKGEQVPNDLNTLYKTGGKLLPPADYKGGLASYLNNMTRHLGKKYPQLELPNRIFPEMHSFGYINAGDRRVDPENRFSNRLVLSMEWVPKTLEQVAVEGYQAHSRERNGGSGAAAELDFIQSFAGYLRKHAPLAKLKEVKTTLDILGAYGLAFGDLKFENIGISGNELLLLDPGTAVKKGSLQDFASPEYLPDGTVMIEGRSRNPQQEFASGELRAHPWFDQVALHKMMQQLVTGGLDAAMESMKQSYEATREEHKKTMTQRALKNLGGRRY